MKRRRFIQTMAAAPALAVPAAAATAQQPARQAPDIPRLEMSVADAAAAYTPRFFYGIAIFRAAQTQRHFDACAQ